MAASDGGPSRSLEVERKYDVDAGTALPDWTSLPGVASVDEPEPRDLDAQYLDTATLALGRSGVALRRRTGGPDEGWHVKISRPEGKHEWQWPLDADGVAGSDVPAVILGELARWTTDPLVPLARIRNARTAYALRASDGGLIAEVVDDRVRARDERRGTEDSWREWEVELGPACPVDAATFFAAADALVAGAGGRVAAAGSKLGRILNT